MFNNKMKNIFLNFLFFLFLSHSNVVIAIPESFADLVESLSPSVVSIASTTVVRDTNPQDQIPRFPEGSPFDEFFKAVSYTHLTLPTNREV